MTSTRATIAAIAAALFAIVAAPAAHASESGFVNLLDDYGFHVATADSQRTALLVGDMLCDEMRAGTPRDQLVNAVVVAIPKASREQAGQMVFAAHDQLCPNADPDGHGI